MIKILYVHTIPQMNKQPSLTITTNHAELIRNATLVGITTIAIVCLYLLTTVNNEIKSLHSTVDSLECIVGSVHADIEEYNDITDLWLVVDFDRYPEYTDYILRVYESGIINVVDSINWNIVYKEGLRYEDIDLYLQRLLDK